MKKFYFKKQLTIDYFIKFLNKIKYYFLIKKFITKNNLEKISN